MAIIRGQDLTHRINILCIRVPHVPVDCNSLSSKSSPSENLTSNDYRKVVYITKQASPF